MKRISTLFFLLLCLSGLRSQSYVLSNKSQLTQKKSIYHRPIGRAGDHYLFLNYAEENLLGGFSVESYNDEFGFEKDRFFSVPRKTYVLKVFNSDTTLYWVSLYRKGSQKSKVWLNSIGYSFTGAVQSKLIFEFEDNSTKVGQFIAEVSANKNEWVLAWTNSVPKNHNRTLLQMRLFNLEGLELKNGHVELDIHKQYLDWHTLSVNNQHQAVAVIQGNEPKDLFARNSKITDFYALSLFDSLTLSKIQFYNSNAGQVSDEIYPMNLILAVNPMNQQFNIGGLYTDRDFYNQLGYFLFQRSEDLPNWNLNYFSPFESSEIMRILGVKRVKTNQFPRNYFPRKLVFNSKNRHMMFFEEYTETRQLETYYVNGIPQTSTKILYHYGNILGLVLDTNQLHDSCLVIKKDQTATINNLYYLSFGTYICENGIHLVYNDDIAQNNEVVDVKIQSDLAVVRKSLIDSRNFYNVVIPFDGKEMEYCSFTVPLYREKQWFWAHISGND